MRKFILFIFMLTIISGTCFAETIDLNKSTVAFMYINNTVAPYADKENKKIVDNFNKVLEPYKVVAPTACFEYLTEAGIDDFTMADREDILKAFNSKGIDYAIFIELQSISFTNDSGFLSNTTTATAVIPLRIVNLKSGKYLYNSKIIETKKDTASGFGVTSDRSIALDTIDNAIIKINNIITSRIPLTQI